jgi:uncharacterized membrane protein YdjX (TVP38/TMEM64 family)
MEVIRRHLMDKRVQITLVSLFALGIAGGVVAWKMGLNLEILTIGWSKTTGYLETHPWIFFFALVFLPGLPVPITALSFTAGVVWRQQPLTACLLFLLALVLNLTWTYWLAAGPGRRLIETFLRFTSIKLPELPQISPMGLILVTKLTPGVPLFFQSYTLGLLRVPFRWYLLVSMLCNGILGTGAVLSGVGLGDGKLMPAISGISLVALAAVLTQLTRKWLQKRKLVIVNQPKDC